MTSVAATIQAAVTALQSKPAARGFLLSEFFTDGPRSGHAALSADTSYAAARVIETLGLAERVNDGTGTNWFYLNRAGVLVRQHFRNLEAKS